MISQWMDCTQFSDNPKGIQSMISATTGFQMISPKWHLQSRNITWLEELSETLPEYTMSIYK